MCQALFLEAADYAETSICPALSLEAADYAETSICPALSLEAAGNTLRHVHVSLALGVLPRDGSPDFIRTAPNVAAPSVFPDFINGSRRTRAGACCPTSNDIIGC